MNRININIWQITAALISLLIVLPTNVNCKLKTCFSGTATRALEANCPENLNDACVKTVVETPQVTRTLYGCASSAACNRRKSIIYKSNDANSITFNCCYTDNCYLPEFNQFSSSAKSIYSELSIFWIFVTYQTGFYFY